MLPFNAARELISKDEPLQAIELLMTSLDDKSEKNDLILLSARLNTWQAAAQKGFSPPNEDKVLTIQSLLYKITELEVKIDGASRKRRLQLEIEREMLHVCEKAIEYSKPADMTMEALRDLFQINPELYNYILFLSSTKARLINMWQNPEMDVQLSLLLKEKERELSDKVEQISEQVLQIKMKNPSHPKLISLLLRNNLDNIPKYEYKARHREACKRLLNERFSYLKIKREKLVKSTGLALLGFALGMSTNSSIFGKGYDDEGYDEKGFNADGFNREGFDEKGMNQLGFNRLDTPESVSYPVEKEYSDSDDEFTSID
ncbi:MAG TPA: hypothetical protein PLZ12_20925 [Saprospiraceae bacterium]|nr:hypothetical protein [Saprospiraceae bacterium]